MAPRGISRTERAERLPIRLRRPESSTFEYADQPKQTVSGFETEEDGTKTAIFQKKFLGGTGVPDADDGERT